MSDALHRRARATALLAALAMLSCTRERAARPDTAAAPAAPPPAAASPTFGGVDPSAPAKDTVFVPKADTPGVTTPPSSVPNGSAARDSGRRPLRPRPPHPVPRPMPRSDSAGAIAPRGGDQASDQAVIDRLKAEAKALAHVDGCTAASQCAVQALGERACGGADEYVVYCPRSTDVAALRRKADTLARAARAFNAKYEIASTCEYRVAPAPQLVGGSCRAASAGGKAAVPR